ncbi:LolA family protein [Bythopirellula polymerisocia]|uniref:Uncharacterized protein n=1 Tax=Bythopirellula polymerisocia TaxID=2528003 RepID=A0A5C6CZL8_9BACT|nr:DUF2092 domain-containing protein [Bythopirellula polymerisocia]TWU29375.1 hypothetical protein Pla144_01510 [Bythopirellula polymerisocia]
MDQFEKRMRSLRLRKPSLEFGEPETLRRIENLFFPASYRDDRGTEIIQVLLRSKVAAVLSLVSALLAILVLALPLTSGSPAFAQVLEKLRSAKTMAFTLVTRQGSNGKILSKGRVYCMAPGKVRIDYDTIKEQSSYMVFDQAIGNLLLVDETRKTAQLIPVQQSDNKQRKTRDPAIQMIKDMQALTDQATKLLGYTKMNGEKAIIVAIEEKNKRTKIWANDRTAEPLKIEVLEKSEAGKLSTQVLTDIQLDIQLEEEIFRVVPPVGYAVEESESAPLETTRAHQVAGFLRIYTKYMNGELPPVLAEAGPKLSKHLQATKSQNPPITEMMKLAFYGAGVHAVGRGQPGRDWQYFPEATIGDPEVMIFWYLDQKSGNYWAIYGDLRVEKVNQNQLP